MTTALGLVAAMGAAVAIGVLLRMVNVRMRVKMNVTINDLRDLSRSVHERVGEYMRANYSGDPAQLEGALRGLLPHVREIVRGQGKTLDDDVLRALLVASIAAHRAATRHQVEAALDEVLRTERSAA